MQPKLYPRMRSKIDIIQPYGGPHVALLSGSVGWHILTKWMDWNTENPEIILTYTIGGKILNILSCHAKIGAWPIKVLAMQRVYKYITNSRIYPIIDCQNKLRT